MRVGIISDIHGNVEALDAVMMELRDVDAIYCLGDVVGYGPNPNECCDIIRERKIPTVLGNHDAGAIGSLSLEWFNPPARIAAQWTADRLTARNRFFLQNLPLIRKTEHLCMVHGSLNDPERFGYIKSIWDARESFAEMGSDTLCFLGHTHIAEYFRQGSRLLQVDHLALPEGGRVAKNSDSFYIVNCGSVGQPRDGNPMAGFGIYDTDSSTIDLLRVEYPFRVTQSKMRDLGLPTSLQHRLEIGQ